MIELNLLEKKEPFRMPIVLGIDLNELNLIMLMISVLIWIIPMIVVESRIESDKSVDTVELEQINKQLDTLKKYISKNAQIKEMLKAYQEQLERLKSRSSQVDEILKSKTNPKKILEKIARSVPDDLWFNELKITSSDEIQISGGSYSSRSLGELITLMNDSPYFSGTITPSKQENKQETLDGVLTNYDVFELRGKIKSYDMRSK